MSGDFRVTFLEEGEGVDKNEFIYSTINVTKNAKCNS